MHYILINVHIINTLFPDIYLYLYMVAYNIARQTIIYLTCYFSLFCLITCFSLQTHPTSHHLIVFNPSSPNSHPLRLWEFYQNNGCCLQNCFKTLSWEKFDIIGALPNMQIKSGPLRSVSILSDLVHLIHQYWNFVYRTMHSFFFTVNIVICFSQCAMQCFLK